MDTDYPIQKRASGTKKYFVSLFILGGVGVAWVLVAVASFAVVRLRSTTTSGAVIAYERAGGSERLRIQTFQDEKPRGFMLLDSTSAWPRYAEGQHVEVLTWYSTNHLGQRVQESMAYSVRNYWQKHAFVLVIALSTMVVGVFGIRRSNRQNG